MWALTVVWRRLDEERTWAATRRLSPVIILTWIPAARHSSTGHVLSADVNNPTKEVTCVIHRSTDRGKTWKTYPILPDMLPYDDVTRTYSSRNIIELSDGTYMLGMSGFNGRDCIMFSTDSPHWSYDAPDWAIRRFPADQRERIMHEHGIPTLLLEADHNDTRAFSPEQVDNRLSAFMEMVEGA